jgi:glycosyltransferase involved in cell wall biosynthesis
LIILGELDLAGFPGLAPFVGRIEKRPRVPFPDLFAELARADINLCPLEPDNLFCDAKSAVRCLAASAVGVPSVVSPTPPLLEAVDNGKSGLVARDAMEWESALDRLIANPHFRNETGRKAQTRALEISDFSKWSLQASGIFQEILPRNRPRPCRS